MADVNLTPVTDVPDAAVVLGATSAFDADDDTDAEVEAKFVQFPVSALLAPVAPEEIHLDNVTIGADANEDAITIDESATTVGTLITAVSNAGVTLRAGSYMLSFTAEPNPATFRAHPQIVMRDTNGIVSLSTATYYRSDGADAGATQQAAVYQMAFYLAADTAVTFAGRQQDRDAAEAGGVGTQVVLDFTGGLLQPVGGIRGQRGEPGAPGTGASPTLANVVAALGLAAVGQTNRTMAIRRKADETGFEYATFPTATGGGPTVTHLLPNASQDSTARGRSPLTVWAVAALAQARAAVAAIADPSDGDIAYYRQVSGLTDAVDQISAFFHSGGNWIPFAASPNIAISATTGVLDQLAATVAAIPQWNPNVEYARKAIVEYFNELWIKIVDAPDDRSEPSQARYLDDGQITIWQPMNVASAGEVPASLAPPGSNDRSVQAWINHFAAQELYEAADLGAAYFSEHAIDYALPDAAGFFDLSILDPVNISLALADGDQFVVHAVVGALPEGTTQASLQIRGRSNNSVRSDSVAPGADNFTILTLENPGESDALYVLHLKGTKPATTDATVNVELREVVGVQGGTQPFASSVARMLEDYVHQRLLWYYGVLYFEPGRRYVTGQVVLDGFDWELYRFTPTTPAIALGPPSLTPSQFERMTWPEPANWALESPAEDGLQLVPPARVQYRLPPAWDDATSWPNAAEVIHANAAYRNTSGGALVNVEPGTTDDWTLIANFSAVTPGDLLSQIADWAEQGNTQNIPNGKLHLAPQFLGVINPVEGQRSRRVTLYLDIANEAAPLHSATPDTAGLLSADEHVKLAALLNSTPRGAWAADVEYDPRDLVFDYNGQTGVTVIAEARRTHVASLSTRPAGIDADSDDWWVVAIIRQSPHARSTAELDARIAAAAPSPPSQWRFRAVWTEGANYAAADVVTREVGTAFVLAQAKRDHGATNANPPGVADSDDWAIVWARPGTTPATIALRNRGNWAADTDYVTGDLVYRGREILVALVDNRRSGFTRADWTTLLSLTAYQQFDGRIRLSFNPDDIPTGDLEGGFIVDTESDPRIPLTPVFNRHEWVVDREYFLENTVKRNGTRYYCLARHTSTAANAPGSTGGATYWET